MTTTYGLLGGALGLMLFDTVVSDQAAAGRLQGGFSTLAKIAGDFIDPTKPAIRDRRTATPASSVTSTPVVPPVWTAPPPPPRVNIAGKGG